MSIRPLTPADSDALVAFHSRQSADSIYRRYFSPKPSLSPAELKHFTDFDFTNRASLVVESHGDFIGWASYARWPGRDDADTAFMVDDAHHGKGVATLMLEHLAAIAKANGIERFTAEVLADNRPMLSVFAKAGWPIERRFNSGVDRGRLPARRDRRVRRLGEPARAARRQPGHGPSPAPARDRRRRRVRPRRLGRGRAVAQRHDPRHRTGVRRQPQSVITSAMPPSGPGSSTSRMTSRWRRSRSRPRHSRR